MSQSPGTYRCQDRWLAATLISLGCLLQEVETHPRRPRDRPGPPWAVFVLQDHPDRPRWVREYHAQQVHANIAQVRDTYHRLRDLTREVNQGAGRKGA